MFAEIKKMFLVFQIVILMLVTLALKPIVADGTEEFCNSETFKASCSNNEVIVINAAKYGRMSVGKCISEEELEAFGPQRNDKKYLGCFRDVTERLNKNCSLKANCEMKVVDLEKKDDTFCYPGLKSHLEVTYSCIQIFRDEGECKMVARNEAVFVDARSFNQNGVQQLGKRKCLTIQRPLVLETLKGQRIKLSMKRLDRPAEEADSLLKEACADEHGYIFGTQKSSSNATICSSAFKVHATKNGNTHVSMSTVFEVNDKRLNVYFYHLRRPYEFLIGVEANGCLDIIPHEDWWLKRDNDDLVVGCFLSPQKWYLRCENRQWTGVLGNCSIPSLGKGSNSEPHLHDESHKLEEQENLTKKHQTLIIACICGSGVVVCVLILCSGAICLKSYSKKEMTNNINYNSMPIYQQQQQQQFAMMTLRQQQQAQEQRMDYSACEEDRYQVLDRDEVAKQEPLNA